jgi:hypothetical protein
VVNSERGSEASPERPIESSKQDILGRSGFAGRIANSLVDPESGRATGVVVAVTGPWGSGKSSVLNLIEESLEARKDADLIVVRFNPWLISSRDDLIQQFFVQLALSLKASDSRLERAARVLRAMPTYARDVLPIASEVVVAAATGWWTSLLSPAAKLAGLIFSKRKGLTESKKELQRELENSGFSIAVLVDEVDRVTDEEIMILANLVRSIVDFPGVSYCLAYDRDRVAEALGGGNRERGQLFLEKIVQFSFNLPYTFADELRLLLAAELTALGDQFDSRSFLRSRSYKEVEDILVAGLVENPRDIKRMIGIFRVLLGAVGDEVLRVDLLAFAILQSKFPSIVDEIRKNPELFVEDPLDPTPYFTREGLAKKEGVEIITSVFGDIGSAKVLAPLLAWLFPLFSEGEGDQNHRDEKTALSYRRPLLTLLRMGLIPGYFSTTELLDLVRSPERLRSQLDSMQEAERLSRLMQQLYEVVPISGSLPDKEFWNVFAEYVEPKGDRWLRPLHIEQTVVDDVSRLFRKLGAGSQFRQSADLMIEEMISKGQHNLVLHILWDLFAAYGLFGGSMDTKRPKLLSKSRVEELGLRLSRENRLKHLEGTSWIGTLGSVLPLLLIWLTGEWDDRCKQQLRSVLEIPIAVDCLAFMFFGDHHAVGLDVVEAMIGVEHLSARVTARLSEKDPIRPARYHQALEKTAQRLRALSTSSTNSELDDE